MPLITAPWDDDEQWLPRIEPLDAPSQWARMNPGIAAPATPPFLPPSAPPPPPIAPLRPPSSLEALRDLEMRRPIYGDPQYKPSKTRNVLGNIAGAAAGAAAGYLNAGGRVRVDPNVGAKLGDNIKNIKFNRAARDFEAEREGLANVASIDAKIEDDRRRVAESQARIESERAQKEAAEAARKRAERVDAPRPVAVGQGQILVDPITGRKIAEGDKKPEPIAQNWQARIIQIRTSDAPSEEKERLIKELEDDYKRVNPEKGTVKFVEDAAGNITALTTTPGEVTAAGGKKQFGKLGKGRDTSPTQGEQTAQTRKADESEAMRLLAENTGDHDKAIAAAKSMGVRKALQEDKRRGKLGSSDTGKGDLAKKARAALGIPEPDGKKQPVVAKPVTQYKQGDIVEKGGKRYRIKAVLPDGRLDVDPV